MAPERRPAVAARRAEPGRPAPRWRRAAAGAVVWAVSLPALAALAVALAAPFVDPRAAWWAQATAVLLPYLAWAVVGTALVAVWQRRWRLVAIQAVLLVWAFVRTEPIARLGAAPCADPAAECGDAVRLVSFNVPGGIPRNGVRDSMLAFVRREGPAVLAMQDSWVRGPRRSEPAWRAPQIQVLLDSLPAFDLAVPAALPGVGGWKRDATGVPLLVADGGPAVLEQEAVIVSDPADNTASQAIRSVLRWRGRDLVLYNVHIRSFGDPKPWADSTLRLTEPATWGPVAGNLRQVYRDRAIDVDRIVEAIAQETLPVIVAGDFNSTADNWTYRRLRRAGGVARDDAFREGAGWRWGRTYHARRPAFRIDHVLTDPRLEVVAAETRAVGFSDHRPVLVGLRWRDGAAEPGAPLTPAAPDSAAAAAP